MMGPNATKQESQQLPEALIASFDVGVSPPQQDVLNGILASRNSLQVASAELWSALQAWSTKTDNLAVDGNHLEQNREQDFIAALIRLEVSMSSVIRPRFAQSPMNSPEMPPASKFEANWPALLRDPGVETVFVMRALRSRLLLAAHEDAIGIATGIIGQLEKES